MNVVFYFSRKRIPAFSETISQLVPATWGLEKIVASVTVGRSDDTHTVIPVYVFPGSDIVSASLQPIFQSELFFQVDARRVVVLGSLVTSYHYVLSRSRCRYFGETLILRINYTSVVCISVSLSPIS